MYKKILFSIMAMFLAVLWAMPVSAAQFTSGESVTVSSADDDVYAAGANIFADGEINGDLYMAGAVIRNNANVSEDFVAAGSIVDLFGNVGDDARLAGSMVTIGGVVEDDLIVFGAMVRILPGAIIKGDLTTFGGSLMIDGTVEGNVIAGGGQVILNGTVMGSAILEADEVVIGKSANVGGIVQYKSPKEAEVAEEAAIAGGVEYKKIERSERPERDREAKKDVGAGALFGLGVLVFLIKVLVGIATVLVALYFFKKHLFAMTKTMLSEFPAQLGWGFVWALLVPIACIVLIFTVFGSTLGVFGLIVYALTMVIAKALAMIGFGAWLWKLVTKGKTIELDWKIAVLGVVVLNVIGLIPLIGWVFCLVFTLAALGATMTYLKQSVK
jgi:cytoskeletal protein CcmA (bactofilin family)